MKRDYLDKAAASGNTPLPGESVTRKINGQEWYDQSAMRAVNQVEYKINYKFLQKKLFVYCII